MVACSGRRVPVGVDSALSAWTPRPGRPTKAVDSLERAGWDVACLRTFLHPLRTAPIRNHPDARVDENDIPVTGAPGSAARVWSVCLDVCARGEDSTWVDGILQQALEVTRDGFRTSALHDFTPGASVSHAVEDWFFVTSGGPALVDSQGRRHLLTKGGSLPVTSVAGPLVYAPQGVAWVDLETRQLHALESDAGVWDWSGAADTWFWGNVYLVDDAGRVTQQGLTWRNPDGTLGVRMLPIEITGYSTQMLPDGTPGTMAAVDPGLQLSCT